MLIALDFDKTYSEDPELWNIFIRSCRERGHRILCVTARYPEENWFIEDTIGKQCQIIYTSRKAKLKFVNEEKNIFPDVWIDDDPLYIFKDHLDTRMWNNGE